MVMPMDQNRAVLLAWDREPLPDEECRHLNDCHDDNRLENLCWGSRQENVDDKRVNDKMPVGERSGTHKLTEAEVLEIRKARGTASLRELGAKYGVSHTAIRRAMLGIKWGYPRSVIKGPSDKQTSHLHPTQKPVWLCERLVLTYTNPGEVVLDCCAGSASIGVACCRTERRYIGIENEKQYYDVMRTRLRECCRSHSKEVG